MRRRLLANYAYVRGVGKRCFVSFSPLSLAYIAPGWARREIEKERIMCVCANIIIQKYYLSLLSTLWMVGERERERERKVRYVKRDKEAQICIAVFAQHCTRARGMHHTFTHVCVVWYGMCLWVLLYSAKWLYTVLVATVVTKKRERK